VGAAVRRALFATCVSMLALAGAGCTSILGDDFHFNLFPVDAGPPIPDASLGDASPRPADGGDASLRTDAGDASLSGDSAGNDGAVNDIRRDTSVDQIPPPNDVMVSVDARDMGTTGCMAGQKECRGTDLYTCSMTGMWQLEATCPYLCVTGA